jgi:hypothetical protein
MCKHAKICCDCGDLFYPDADDHNTLNPDGKTVHEFYVCDECIEKQAEEREQESALECA